MGSFWSGRRVLVTGATGFIGSWLTKALLERDAQVTALVKDVDPQSELYRSGAIQQIRVINGRLEDAALLERAISEHEIEVVFHLAAQALVPVAYRSPLATFETNIRGTYNLLEACRRHAELVRRVVIASSDKAYGEQSGAYHETMSLEPQHPYDVSKASAELIARTYHRTYGVPLAIARCGNIYGGGDLNWSRIVPGTIRAILRQEPFVIRSNGRLVRDYFYVKDAADAYVQLAEQLDRAEVLGEAFNFSHEAPMTVLEAVEAVQRVAGGQPAEIVVQDAARAELQHQVLSAERARQVLGWAPAWSLEDGLAETIEWYRSFFATGTQVPQA